MYSLINRISHVVGQAVVKENTLFIRKQSTDVNLQVYRLKFNGEVLWSSREERVLGFYLLNNEKIIFNSKKEKITICRNFNNNDLVFKINEILYDLSSTTPNIYENLYYSLSEIDNNTIYDLSTGETIGVVDKKILGFIVL